MYKILLVNADGTYKYHQVENTITKLLEDFDVDTLDDLEFECVKLLYEYNASQIVPVADVKYSVDLLWENPDGAGTYFPGLDFAGVTNPTPTGKNVKFKILIKQTGDNYKFYSTPQEIMITNKNGVTIGSGKFEDIDYEATGFEDLEKQSLELLKDYPYTSIKPVIVIEFVIDLLWTNIDGLTIAMQQKLFDIATAQQIINTIRGGGTS